MATISTHLGGGKVRQAHNRREERCVRKEAHIRENGNIEIWQDVPEREAYHRIFDQAQKEYNEHQNRPERKIKSYYNKVAHNEKMHTSYELIVGVYGSGKSKDEQRQILREYLAGFVKRNPNMKVFGAYKHDDEQNLDDVHLHIDIIPFADGYKNGMSRQAGFNKALEAEGFITKGRNTAQIQWEAAENLELEKICVAHNIVVEHPQAGKTEIQHLQKQVYLLQKQIENLTTEVGVKEAEKLKLANELSGLYKNIKAMNMELGGDSTLTRLLNTYKFEAAKAAEIVERSEHLQTRQTVDIDWEL